MDVAEDGIELGAEGGIESAGGFVEEEEAGLGDEGSGDGGALFLASGELVGVASDGVEEAEAFEEVVDAAVAFEPGEVGEGEFEVLAEGHVWE